MPFVKGQSGNPAGKKAGTLNARTRHLRSIKEFLAKKNVHILDIVFDAIKLQKTSADKIDDPVERTKALNELTKRALDIMPYVVPKLKELDMDMDEEVDVTPGYIDPNQVIEEASNESILRVLQSYSKPKNQ